MQLFNNPTQPRKLLNNLYFSNRVGEIPLRREISTSHTTVRTVPYTAVQST